MSIMNVGVWIWIYVKGVLRKGQLKERKKRKEWSKPNRESWGGILPYKEMEEKGKQEGNIDMLEAVLQRNKQVLVPVGEDLPSHVAHGSLFPQEVLVDDHDSWQWFQNPTWPESRTEPSL